MDMHSDTVDMHSGVEPEPSRGVCTCWFARSQQPHELRCSLSDEYVHKMADSQISPISEHPELAGVIENEPIVVRNWEKLAVAGIVVFCFVSIVVVLS